MKKRGERVSRERRGSGLEEEPLKTEEDYQCSGNVELDFPELCALHGMREIPLVKLKQPLVSSPPTDSGETDLCYCLGWRVDEMMVQVLNKTLPSLSNLQCLKMWRTGITENILTSLRNTIIMCTNLRTVILEGNPIPEQSYHILMGEDSMINHLSLRNNRIGEEGARLIGSALSTVHSANKNLLTLNMAFNCIGDEGAIYISQGLRFNRTLLCLSLANNQIGDTGASSLAEVLGPFALTHEEIIERRQLMVDQLVITAVSKCEGSLSVPSSSSIDHMNKGSKSIPKKKVQSVLSLSLSLSLYLSLYLNYSFVNNKDIVNQEEALNPLLDPDIRHADGKVIHPGNNTLISLNLSGNKLTEQSVQKFLSSVVGQDEGGLLHFFLNRNCFPKDCDAFLKILELMSLKDPLNKTSSGQGDEEQGQEA
uniref:Leucine rich repeat containing 71 n=1 Tax=Astyanax mexicanus TaxID=7994 RepID=A0A3B1J9A2_ASTMX